MLAAGWAVTGRAIASRRPRPAVLVLWPRAGRALDEEGVRVAQLARHELAVAFAGARLREALERERHELAAIVDGATDCIVQVDADGLVIRLNPAGERLLGDSRPTPLGRRAPRSSGCEVAGGHGRAPPARSRRSSPAGGRSPTARRRSAARTGARPGRRRATRGDPGGGGDGARATAILRDVSAVPRPRGAARGLRRDGQPRAADPARAHPRLRRDAPPLDLDAGQQRPTSSASTRPPGRLARSSTRSSTSRTSTPTHSSSSAADDVRRARRPAAGDLALAGRRPIGWSTRRTTCRRSTSTSARIGQVLENLVGNALKYARTAARSSSRRGVDGDVARRRPSTTRASASPRPSGRSCRAVPPGLERPRVAHPGDRPGPVHLPSAGRGPRRPLVARRPARRAAGTRVAFTPAAGAPPGRPRPTWATPTVAETVLIVEDEPEFAGLLELWIGRAGYRTVTARTGPGRAAPLLRRPSRPRHPRRRRARPRRLAARRADPRVQPRADPHGHRPRLGGRQDPRPQARRRRLHHQAAVSFPELIARVEAALRRAATPAPERPRRLRHPRPRRRPRRAPGAPARHEVRLTPTEFRLLAYLVEHAGQLVTHRQVLSAVWGAATTRRPPAADDDPQPRGGGGGGPPAGAGAGGGGPPAAGGAGRAGAARRGGGGARGAASARRAGRPPGGPGRGPRGAGVWWGGWARPPATRRRQRGLFVGLNPSPVSVEAGHYHQGRLGGRSGSG